jgi:hypothetical protein
MVGFLLKISPSAHLDEEIDPMHISTHIAALLKLTAQQLEALRIPKRSKRNIPKSSF